MKMIFGAIALALAVPAIAQTAPAKDAPAEHDKAKHDCKACCEKMKQQGGKMECMDKKGEAKPASSDTGSHQGHEAHAQ